MQFHTQKEELTETLRLFLFTCKVHCSHTFNSITILVFPSHLSPECGCCAFTACDTFLVYNWSKQQICGAQSNTNSAKEDPTCSAELFEAKTQSEFLHLWILCHQALILTAGQSRGKNDCNVQFSLSAFSDGGLSPYKLSFLSFFCPLEGKLM